jgi:hypothetical protein
MSATSLAPASLQEFQPALAAAPAQAAGENCEECLGSGGWHRYEPALEPSPGMLYLSCLHCRGSGRALFAQA